MTESLEQKLSIVPDVYAQRFGAIIAVLEQTPDGKDFSDRAWEQVLELVQKEEDWTEVLRFFRKMVDRRDYQKFLREVCYTRLASIPDVRLFVGG